MIITNATAQDVHDMLQLDYKYFPEEWHLSEEWVKEAIQINPNIYRVIKSNGQIKGYYCFYPISRGPYEKLLSGVIHECDLLDYLHDYMNPCEVYLYLLSIIVDINDPIHKSYTRQLIKDIPKLLDIINSKGITVKEIGAIAISDDGVRILRKMGLTETDNLSMQMATKFIVYRGKLPGLTIE
ncbi:hypothetical protein [Pseudobacteroides cellulosolvens]|uniref:N-acetyltransferase domain-containing protein n=1 Tax=Pseudobacteroides cellulosolvens ATCC 35603 = DSM 2933 TaxID=398512 RepID=A0A0L6JX25_9FIRM|nr:hypothetical protein [Pseudobacteroides cellulosolvens]KNY30279.1 hypothetical protein Bccel_5556 [Pseudobacteroides cellulosolvens ATCC 35603 = DSM 2933]